MYLINFLSTAFNLNNNEILSLVDIFGNLENETKIKNQLYLYQKIDNPLKNIDCDDDQFNSKLMNILKNIQLMIV